jgi:hypothetical protein
MTDFDYESYLSEENSTSDDVTISSPVTKDITTSALPPRLAADGDHIREYSPVLHDKPVRETPAVGSDGKRFGTNVLPEPISVSLDNARTYLALVYGYDVADSMCMRAMATGRVINGELFKVTDTQARTKGKMSVTTDKSRPGEFVIVPHILRQSGGKRKGATS